MKSVWALLLVLPCASARAQGFDGGLESLKARLRGPVVAAHAGGVFHPYPNTLSAFEQARADGADIVEMDLRASVDGVPMVYHDEALEARSGCFGKVSENTSARLMGCGPRGGEAFIPTFEEVLRWSRGRVVVNAEFKDFAAIAAAVELVKRYDAYAWVYFQTQDSPEKYAKARAADPKVALLYAPRSAQSLAWALSLNDDHLAVIELHENLRTPETIAAVHAAGKLVSENSWHFGSAHELFGAVCDRVFALGIDIAVTNRPAGCAQQRDKAR